MKPYTHYNIEQVRIVVDLDGKPRGYGFIEFEREKDMRSTCYSHLLIKHIILYVPIHSCI